MGRFVGGPATYLRIRLLLGVGASNDQLEPLHGPPIKGRVNVRLGKKDLMK